MDKIPNRSIPLDSNLMGILRERSLSKEEFIERYKDTPDADKVYEDLKKSKMGTISVEKLSGEHSLQKDGAKHYGFTAAFGEGIAVYMATNDRWFHTSVIQSIDWDKHEFRTMNSVYKFKFTELDPYSETKEEKE